MKGKISVVFAVFSILLLGSLALANSGHSSNIEEGKILIESNLSCSQFDNEQLEAIGEYYMEQMHPGESHEMMDQMMGGEGSDSLKQVHINMAKSIYCGENIGMNGGMGGGMMGSGMMSTLAGSGYPNFINILFILLLVGLIMLIYLGIVKLWNDLKAKRK